MLRRLLLMAATITIFVIASITASASHTGFTTLNMNGETVKIYRDDFRRNFEHKPMRFFKNSQLQE